MVDYQKEGKKLTKEQKLLYYSYYYNAVKRDIEFNLTAEQFLTFDGQPCAYCGIGIWKIGIDRVDNAIGYEVNNCVPCCKVCNWMKNKTNAKEFIEQCKRIANYT